jgi:hypothetical protein
VNPPRRAGETEPTVLGGRDFVMLVGRLARERSWELLTNLFGALRTDEVALADLDTAARLLTDELGGPNAPKRPNAAVTDELRALRMAAGEAVLARCGHPPVSDLERRAMARAAALLSEAGDHRRAALVYEELGDEGRAAERWGALGDLERMEAALDREERLALIRRTGIEAMRRFEALMAAGERRQAVAIAATAAGIEEAPTLRQLAARIESRLLRGRALTLRLGGGPWVHVAALPAQLGRDPSAELTLRDPAVSRRHALLRAAGESVEVEDTGSRTGVRVGGIGLAAGARVPLPAHGELGIGSVTLRFVVAGTTVTIEGTAGFDASLRAIADRDPVPLAPLAPELDGLAVALDAGAPRLVRRADVPVRVDGHLIGPGCDLLHGDVVEVVRLGNPQPVRLEIE